MSNNEMLIAISGMSEPIKLENDDCFDIIEKCDGNIILCGHTHRRRTIKYGNKTVYNPGSVGAPLESSGKTQFMILHDEDGKWTEEFVDLEYDIGLAIRMLHDEKLDKYAPYWCRVTELLLRTGEISHGKVLRDVMEKCREETDLDVKVGKLIGIYTDCDMKYASGDEAQSICIAYELIVIGGELFCDKDETLELKYFPLNGLPELFCKQHEELSEELRKIYA